MNDESDVSFPFLFFIFASSQITSLQLMSSLWAAKNFRRFPDLQKYSILFDPVVYPLHRGKKYS